MAVRTNTGISRRRMLGFGLTPFLVLGWPLHAMTAGNRSFAVERLFQAALPAHCRNGGLPLELPFADIEAALVRTFGKAGLCPHLLAKLDLTLASCRTWSIVALRERLQRAIRDDFRQGLTIEVDGWCLSETEGIVYALAQERPAWAPAAAEPPRG